MSIPIFLFASFCLFGIISATLVAFRGIFTRNFRFIKDRTLGKKRYTGKQARRWGIIFFLTFGLMSAGLTVIISQEIHFPFLISALYFTLLAFLAHPFNTHFHRYN